MNLPWIISTTAIAFSTAKTCPCRRLAETYGTPLYVYSKATLLHHLRQLQQAFAAVEPLICYSVKTNGNLAPLPAHGRERRRLRRDQRRRAVPRPDGRRHAATRSSSPASARPTPSSATPSKTTSSSSTSRARTNCTPWPRRPPRRSGKSAPVALRVNPDLPPKTHVKTDTSVKGVKFGLDIETILDVARGVVGNPNVRIVGLHMHLGSPILGTQPYREGVAKGLALIEQLREQGHPISVLNMGGGFGIHYRKQEAQPAAAFAEVIVPVVQEGEVPAGAGAGPLHRRQRRHAGQPGALQ